MFRHGFAPSRDGRRAGVKTVAEPAIKPGSVVDNHSSRPCLAAGLKQRTRGRVEPTHSPPTWPCSGWGLPCPAALAPQAVRSYRTLSPSPRASCDAVRLSALCCTFRRLAPPRRYLAPCPVEPGLSSTFPHSQMAERSDCLANSKRHYIMVCRLSSLLFTLRPQGERPSVKLVL